MQKFILIILLLIIAGLSAVIWMGVISLKEKNEKIAELQKLEDKPNEFCFDAISASVLRNTTEAISISDTLLIHPFLKADFHQGIDQPDEVPTAYIYEFDEKQKTFSKIDSVKIHVNSVFQYIPKKPGKKYLYGSIELSESGTFEFMVPVSVHSHNNKDVRTDFSSEKSDHFKEFMDFIKNQK